MKGGEKCLAFIRELNRGIKDDTSHFQVSIIFPKGFLKFQGDPIYQLNIRIFIHRGFQRHIYILYRGVNDQ